MPVFFVALHNYYVNGEFWSLILNLRWSKKKRDFIKNGGEKFKKKIKNNEKKGYSDK